MKKIEKGNKQLKKFFGFGLLAIVLLFVAYVSTSTSKTMASCIFCDIAAGKSPSTEIEFDDGQHIIFKDIKPASTYHYLCITTRHIESLKALTKDDTDLIKQMEIVLKQLFLDRGIDIEDALFGFHMPPFISVKHLHLHGISPRSNMSWTNSFMFKPNTYWFKTVEEAVKYLIDKTS